MRRMQHGNRVYKTSADSGSPTEYILKGQTSMQVPFLEDFINYMEDELFLTEYKLTTIEIYNSGDDVAVEFIYTNQNEIENTVMFARAAGKKYSISCDGDCGCREIYSFDTNSASCSCDDCVMIIIER